MKRILVLPLAAVAAACASGNTPARSTGMPAAATSSSASVKWTGNFQPQQQRVSGVGPTAKNRAFGSVTLVPLKEDANRAKVEITLNAQVQAGQTMSWGIYPGRCGSGSGMSMPLVAPNTLPSLEVIRNGGAQLTSEIALTLPKTGQYFVNVYWGNRTSDLTDVLTCANLKAEAAQ